MIIKNPTGLYKTAIPAGTSSGTVLYTISNEPPPKSDPITLQLPFASTVREREPGLTDEDRRVTLGELVFTVTSGLQTDPGSAKKPFDLGQVLEFTDLTQDIVSRPLVPDEIFIQHNTNLLDLDEAGISDTEADDLVQRTTDRFNALKEEIVRLQTEAHDIMINISENQKSINEQSKIIEVARIVYDVGTEGEDETFDALVDKLTELEAERNQLTVDLGIKNTEVEKAYNDMLTLSALVK